MTKAYKLSVLYFLLFSILLISSGVMLFEDKIGFSVQGVQEYYLGSEERFIMAKSASGILKIVLPHILAFGIFCMVVLHFVVFTRYKHSPILRPLIWTMFFAAFVEIFSPFLIIAGVELFAYLKILSFFLLQLLVLYVLWMLFHSIIRY